MHGNTGTLELHVDLMAFAGQPREINPAPGGAGDFRRWIWRRPEDARSCILVLDLEGQPWEYEHHQGLSQGEWSTSRGLIRRIPDMHAWMDYARGVTAADAARVAAGYSQEATAEYRRIVASLRRAYEARLAIPERIRYRIRQEGPHTVHVVREINGPEWRRLERELKLDNTVGGESCSAEVANISEILHGTASGVALLVSEHPNVRTVRYLVVAGDVNLPAWLSA